ncbi:hypothetical protein G6F68_011324 [Rhizopus microsporus]|nr:hypothetical protein G6F68_011324 [Rhizopus microsporus]
MRLSPSNAEKVTYRLPRITEDRRAGASTQGEVLRYTFPAEAVPLSAAGAQFSGIGGYTRVRSYQHRTGSEIYEIFAPRAKYPRERQWRTLDLNRQENYDAKGKLTRVILSGPVSGDAYTENLRAYADKGVLKLTPLTSGYSSYRVYDYDAAGRETLSFVCWRYEVSTNKPYAHFPWWEPDPRPKRSREAELQYARTQVGTRCGTPDGKMSVEGMGPVKKLMETKRRPAGVDHAGAWHGTDAVERSMAAVQIARSSGTMKDQKNLHRFIVPVAPALGTLGKL